MTDYKYKQNNGKHIKQKTKKYDLKYKSKDFK